MGNLIKVFMERNNLAINEEFTTSDGNKYFFDDWYYLRAFTDIEGKHVMADQPHLTDLLIGSCEIEKLPFKPKMGDVYWTYGSGENDVFCPHHDGSLYDALRIKNNFAFRTREEAEDPKNIARLKEYCGVLGND